jgi:hypothetical protein
MVILSIFLFIDRCNDKQTPFPVVRHHHKYFVRQALQAASSPSGAAILFSPWPVLSGVNA